MYTDIGSGVCSRRKVAREWVSLTVLGCSLVNHIMRIFWKKMYCSESLDKCVLKPWAIQGNPKFGTPCPTFRNLPNLWISMTQNTSVLCKRPLEKNQVVCKGMAWKAPLHLPSGAALGGIGSKGLRRGTTAQLPLGSPPRDMTLQECWKKKAVCMKKRCETATSAKEDKCIYAKKWKIQVSTNCVVQILW